MATKRVRLIQRRKTVGYSQEQLAVRIGVDRSTVVRWERGETLPQPQQRQRLARVLQVTAEELGELLREVGTPFDADVYQATTAVAPATPASTLAPAAGVPLSEDLALPLLRGLDVLVSARSASGQRPRQREIAYEQLIQFLAAWGRTANRREVLRLLSWAASAAAAAPIVDSLATEEAERLARVVEAPSRVDGQVIDHMENVLHRCMRQDDTLGPQAALDTVLAQRSLARAILVDCPVDHRRRLLSVYSNLSAYAGWLAFDLNDFDGATYYYEAARADAHEAQDTELGALVLCNMSHLATWRGRPRVGIDHAVAAQAWAKRTGNLTLQAYASDRAARAHAMDGQHSACLYEIDTAQARLTEAGDPAGNSLMYFYRHGLLANTRSLCLLALGETGRAVEHAQDSLALIDGSFVRNRAFATLYLANAHAQAGDVDQATAAVAQACELAVRNRSARLVGALRSARAGLQPWAQSRAVSALDDHLVTYGFALPASGRT